MDWPSDMNSEVSPPRSAIRQLPRRAAKVKQPNRVTRSTVSYFGYGSLSSAKEQVNSDSGSDDDNDDDEDRDFGVGLDNTEEGDDFLAPSSSRKRKGELVYTLASKRPRRNATRSLGTATHSRTPNRTSRKPRDSPAKRPTIIEESKPKADPVLAGNWLTLPYMVWLDVFEHVAIPLRDPTADDKDMVEASQTLLSAACAASVLTEPALTALYRSPHLSPLGALLLSRQFTLPREATTFDYRVKVERLRIEVGETLGKKVASCNVNLPDLIRNLPRLKDVELYHALDGKPYRDLKSRIRWKYSDELFEALASVPHDGFDPSDKKTPTELRSWMWSSRLAGESCSLDKLQAVHRTPSFSSLQKITFVNYQSPSLDAKRLDEAAIIALDMPVIEQLAAAISALPHLEHLVFESSTIVNGPLLSRLPKNLKHLQLINCYDVLAETLQDFLLTHGHHLEQLTLDHCQALSLAFLPVLGIACPKLTHLHMNLRYYSTIASTNDNKPDYDFLLEKCQPPTWPSSLQHLDIQHMRHWGGDSEIETATMFFKSLTESASALPNLRHIVLRAQINAPIRDRTKFRNKWVMKMEDIFKRPFDDPKPVPRRPQAPRVQSQRQYSTGTRRKLTASTTPMRRSTRIVEKPMSPVTPEVGRPSQRLLINMARMQKEPKKLRICTSRRGYHADDEDSEDELSMASLEDSPVITPIFKQRMCNVVDIQVDNQKIVEQVFGMDDFMGNGSPEDSDDTDFTM